jgi:cytochrome b
MSAQRESTLIWEWPLRCWHWLFALCISASLISGLSGEIAWMDWHLRFGYCALGLLAFRLVWGLIGGSYSRWSQYRLSPRAIFEYFRTGNDQVPHTAPGIGLALLLLGVVLVQAVSGLYTTDDIFVEGPLVRGASEEVVSFMSAMHHRVFWLVIGVVTIHLLAHGVYLLRGSRMPLSMFTGRKLVDAETAATPSLSLRALVSAAVVALMVWSGLNLLA